VRGMAARETDQAGCARSAARDSSALSHRPEVPIWNPFTSSGLRGNFTCGLVSNTLYGSEWPSSGWRSARNRWS
jgi:hypothetical protein